MVTGATSANISWAPPDPNLQNGIIIYYTVVLTDLMFNMPDRVDNTTLPYYTFTGLEEYARYAFNVAAATQAGLGPFSLALRFTTFEDSEYMAYKRHPLSQASCFVSPHSTSPKCRGLCAQLLCYHAGLVSSSSLGGQWGHSPLHGGDCGETHYQTVDILSCVT